MRLWRILKVGLCFAYRPGRRSRLASICFTILLHRYNNIHSVPGGHRTSGENVAFNASKNNKVAHGLDIDKRHLLKRPPGRVGACWEIPSFEATQG